MTNSKNTRRALLGAVLSLIICVSMLVGTTFAWFTDTASTTVNSIQSGTLDIELQYQKADGSWANAEGITLSFKKAANAPADEQILWEPGCTYELPAVKVVNKGNLAVKYEIAISGIDGDAKLNEVIDWTYNGEADLTASGSLLANAESSPITIKGHMQETAGNEYQNLTIDGIAITVFATQLAHEYDSFGNQYDKDSAVDTVAEAEALMADNKPVVLAGCNESDAVLNVPDSFTQTLTIVSSNLKSVQAEKDANIVIVGDVVIDAKDSATGIALMSATEETFDGSAISANGKLNISGTGKLTAIAADIKGAAGIGGMNTTAISIKDITIVNATGSFAYGVGSDTKYYKDAPEGGAAIGSGYNGATITLDSVNRAKAIGGSKAAGIGACYHTGITVTIKNSTIAYVEGGVSAAGIGGSRISNGATENGITINITDTAITAKGGVYGAGIGSGYDAHCQPAQPLCTINIDDSTINATGGKYAAGVGTGYHNAALTGEIKNSSITAVSGDKIYKSTYTPAMDIGFGVVDPEREGLQTDSKLICNGTTITIESAPAIALSSSDLNTALTNGETSVLLGNGNYVIPDSAKSKTFTIIGSDNTVIATQDDGSYEGCDYSLEGATVTFENITINTDSHTYTGYARCKGTYKNCTINGTYTLYDNSTFENCTFNVSGDVYNIWTWGAPEATFTNCTFNSDGKAMLLYGTANTKLALNDCTFNDKGALEDKKAAVEIGNDYGKSYELIVNNTVVNGYEINDKGIITGSTLWGNKNSMSTDKLNVVIDGVDVY